MGNSPVFESILQMAQGQQGSPSGEGGAVPGGTMPPGRIGARPPMRSTIGKPGMPGPVGGGTTDPTQFLHGKMGKGKPGLPPGAGGGKLPAPGGELPEGPGMPGLPRYPGGSFPMPPRDFPPYDRLPMPDPTIGTGTGSNSRTSTDWGKRHPEPQMPQLPEIWTPDPDRAYPAMGKG